MLEREGSRQVFDCKYFWMNPMSIMMLTFAPLFAGLLKELLKSDRFVAILMNNSKPEEESENSDLLEGENPLPLILKKVID